MLGGCISWLILHNTATNHRTASGCAFLHPSHCCLSDRITRVARLAFWRVEAKLHTKWSKWLEKHLNSSKCKTCMWKYKTTFDNSHGCHRCCKEVALRHQYNQYSTQPFRSCPWPLPRDATGPWDHDGTMMGPWNLERESERLYHPCRGCTSWCRWASGNVRGVWGVLKTKIERKSNFQERQTVSNSSSSTSVPLCICILPLLELDCVSRLGTRCLLCSGKATKLTHSTKTTRTRSRHSRLTHPLHWNQDLLSPSHARAERPWDIMPISRMPHAVKMKVTDTSDFCD